MKKYIVTAFLAVIVSACCLVPAHADKITTIAEIIKWGLTPDDVNVGEDELVARRDKVLTLWQSYSSVSDMARAYLSYDALSDLTADLNSAGYPCYLEYNRNLQLYVIRGSGPVDSLGSITILDRYLTNGERGLFCCWYNTDTLLSVIEHYVSEIPSRLLYQTEDGIPNLTLADLSYNIWQRLEALDTRLTSFIDGHTVSDIIAAIPAASDLSTIESTLSSINDKLDNLPGFSGSVTVDTTPIVNAINTLNKNVSLISTNKYNSRLSVSVSFPTQRNSSFNYCSFHVPIPADAWTISVTFPGWSYPKSFIDGEGHGFASLAYRFDTSDSWESVDSFRDHVFLFSPPDGASYIEFYMEAYSDDYATDVGWITTLEELATVSAYADIWETDTWFRWYSARFSSFQTWLGNKLDNLPASSGSSADLSNIESALSTIIDKMDNLPSSVDNIVVNITEDNSAYNIFYVEDENGDKKSVTSVAGDSLSASGKLLQFLYKLIIGSAISDVDNSIGGLNDFFFDNAPSGLGEGVTVWD